MRSCYHPFHGDGSAGEKGPLAGEARYIWGVSLIKRAALSATRCTGEKIGEKRGWPVFNGWQTTGEVRGRLNNVRVVRETAPVWPARAEGKRGAVPTKTVNLPIKLRLTIRRRRNGRARGTPRARAECEQNARVRRAFVLFANRACNCGAQPRKLKFINSPPEVAAKRPRLLRVALKLAVRCAQKKCALRRKRMRVRNRVNRDLDKRQISCKGI